MKAPMDDEKRIRLLKAYLRELTYLCRARYRGDFDRMPKKVKVNWTSVLRRSKVKGITPGYVSRVVGHASDALWDRT
jgi:hypothetical protein